MPESTNGRRLRRASAIALFLAASVSLANAQTIGSASPDRFLHDIQTLTTPQMEGRGDGTPGLTKAQQLLVQRYASLGLQPKGTDGFLQPFDVVVGAELTPDNRFTVQGVSGQGTLVLNQDYVPYSFSAPGEADGGLVFAGYGVTADEWKYDDYGGVDVRDKIVVVLQGEPALDTTRKPKSGATEHGDAITKAILARKHGAKAVVIVNGKLAPGEADLLPHFGGDGSQDDVGIPLVAVKNDVAAGWFRSAGKDLFEVQHRIDASGTPASFAFPATLQVALDAGVKKKHAQVSNVLAYLPGKTDQYVIVGAHYDHLGRGEYGSLAPSKIGQLFPGADDNASGTSALLEIARLLAPLKGKASARNPLLIVCR